MIAYGVSRNTVFSILGLVLVANGLRAVVIKLV